MNEHKPSILNSIQTRILGLFLLIILVVLTITVFVVKDGTYDHSIRQALIHSDTSARTVSEKLIDQETVLKRAITGLAGNFNVKELIADAIEDKESLFSAMQNFQTRFGADVFFVFDGNNRLLSSSLALAPELDPKSIHDTPIYFTSIDNKSYLLTAAPMKFVKKSRHTDAWIVMGVLTEKVINQSLFDITQVHISLVKMGKPLSIFASTFPLSVQTLLANQPLLQSDSLSEVTLAGKIYFYDFHSIVEGSDYQLFLATAEDQAFVSYNTLIGDVIVLLLVSAVLALVSAAVFSKVISDPIHGLVKAADHIRKGEHVSTFPTCSTNEVNSLTNAIRDMQSGIQSREKQINSLAYFDDLTGLPNRNQFNSQLEKAFSSENQSPVMIALLDIDRFKEINDTVGHETGDRLLGLISKRLKNYANAADFYARTGGDEFAIIFDSPDLNRCDYIAQQVMQLFEQPFTIDNLVLDVDVSMGLAYSPEHAATAQALFQCADIALYSCKGKHDSYALYDPKLNKYSLQRLNLMSELKEALHAGQLELHYQPKISIQDNSVTNVESLIRWIHPVHGFIPPDEFIGLAEQTGAIRSLTHWVLGQSLRQVNRWQQDGKNIGVAVNISAVDLVDLRLPGYVSQLLTEYDVDPSLLTLEITESAIMGDPETAIKSLQSLRRMGIFLSIDDFGTGFSSMAQLKKMPVHELKIDKAFVLELADNKDDKVMVTTLVSLANNLGLTTVAEGVENQASLDYLGQIGCTKGQGFHMSRPLPIDKFDAWYESYTSE